WHDRVDPDATVRHLGGERDGQPDEARLARVVGRGKMGTPDPRHLGTDVDDRASRGSKHGPQRGAGAVEDAAQVDIDRTSPLRIGQVPGVSSGCVDPRIVDEDVQAAITPEREFHERVSLVGPAHVHRHAGRGSAPRGDFFDGAARVLEVPDYDPRPDIGEDLRDPASYALRGARDDRDLFPKRGGLTHHFSKSARYLPYPSSSSLATGMKRSAAELMQ